MEDLSPRVGDVEHHDVKEVSLAHQLLCIGRLSE